MQFLLDLWLPIVVSGVGVFIMSALVWTVLPLHKKEFSGIPNEDAVMAALRKDNLAPGRYVLPWFNNGEIMKTAEGRAKVEAGPVAYLTIAPPGVTNMGPRLIQSFLSSIVISAFVAYVAWHTIQPGAPYRHVFRITGMATFMSYALGYLAESVWFAKPWKSMAIQCFDSVLYGAVAAGVFGWLWP